ncbi:unnamed protein product [Sphenostylis stenocarpa]|uniref:Uncharacterized protein n=1 Tax=Sphenostylis stenocarpa TaxID=92480 RepID=A0AA86S9Y4_9FABA|nr:unnamed protein product [Sphenostylis stenocarpa]
MGLGPLRLHIEGILIECARVRRTIEEMIPSVFCYIFSYFKFVSKHPRVSTEHHNGLPVAVE